MDKVDVYADGRLVLGGKTYRCALGKSGVQSDKTEGDGATPAGCYLLRQAYYRADKIAKPTTKLKTVQITPDTAWCDNPSQADYNRLIKLPHAGSYEKLWRDNDVYDIVVPIGYNDNPPVARRGSAIFLHIAKPDYEPTEGCVALSRADLLEVLKEINPKTQICIHP